MSGDVFILGLESRVPGSAYLTTEELFNKVGGNTGNLAFHHAINLHLGGARSLPWHSPRAEINAAGRLAVLPCANQLGDHTDMQGFARELEQMSVPLVAIGLGAQSPSTDVIPPVAAGTLAWVKAIAGRAPSAAPSITVRGEFTLRVLEHYGLADKAVVLGCPSLFINPDPRLGQTIQARLCNPRRVSVAAGHFRFREPMRTIECSLVRMAVETGGSYVGQDDLDMMKLTRGEAARLKPEYLAYCRRVLCPHMSKEEFLRWMGAHGQLFFDVDAWMEHLRRFDFVVGPRIHGVMLALQAGVPALCIALDSRTQELCETMALPFVMAADVAAGIKREDLPRLCNFDPDAFDATRRRLGAAYAGFLESNGISSPQWLRALGAREATETHGAA